MTLENRVDIPIHTDRPEMLIQTNQADLHIHTFGSDGHQTISQSIRSASKKGINVLGITDHNFIRELTKEEIDLAYELGVKVYVGAEYTTQYAHLLVFDVSPEILNSEFRSRRLAANNWMRYVSPESTVQFLEKVKDEGGTVVAAHPANRLPFGSISSAFLKELIDEDLIQATEQYNAALEANNLFLANPFLWKLFFRQVENRLMGANVPKLANSDAHYPHHIGRYHNKMSYSVSSQTVGEILRDPTLKITHHGLKSYQHAQNSHPL